MFLDFDVSVYRFSRSRFTFARQTFIFSPKMCIFNVWKPTVARLQVNPHVYCLGLSYRVSLPLLAFFLLRAIPVVFLVRSFHWVTNLPKSDIKHHNTYLLTYSIKQQTMQLKLKCEPKPRKTQSKHRKSFLLWVLIEFRIVLNEFYLLIPTVLVDMDAWRNGGEVILDTDDEMEIAE